MENSLVAQILHQSYKMPVPAPTHIASGKLVSAPLFSALANESVSKGRCIHWILIVITHHSIQNTDFKTKFTLEERWCILGRGHHKVPLHYKVQHDN